MLQVLEALHRKHATKPLLPYNPTDPNNLTIHEDGVIRFAFEEEVLTPIITLQSLPLCQPSSLAFSITRPVSRNEGSHSDTISALQQERASKPFLLFNPTDLANLTIDEDGVIRFAYEEEISPTSTFFDIDTQSHSVHSAETSILGACEDEKTFDRAQDPYQTQDDHAPNIQNLDTVVPIQKSQGEVLTTLTTAPMDNTCESLDAAIGSAQSTASNNISSPQTPVRDLLLDVESDLNKSPDYTHNILDDTAIFLVQAPLSSDDLNSEIDEEKHFEQLISNLRATAPDELDSSFFDAPFSYRESLLQGLQELKRTTDCYGHTDIFLDPAVILVGKPQTVEQLDTIETREAAKAYFAELLTRLKNSAATYEHPGSNSVDEAKNDHFNAFCQGIEDLMSNDNASLPPSSEEVVITPAQSSDEPPLSIIRQKTEEPQAVEKQDENDDLAFEKMCSFNLLHGPKQKVVNNNSTILSLDEELPMMPLETRSPDNSKPPSILHETTESPSTKKHNDNENRAAEKACFAKLLSGPRNSAVSEDSSTSHSGNGTQIATPQVLSSFTISSEEQKTAKASSCMLAEARIASTTPIPTNVQVLNTQPESVIDWITTGLFGDQDPSQSKTLSEQVKTEGRKFHEHQNLLLSSISPSTSKFWLPSPGQKMQTGFLRSTDTASGLTVQTDTFNSQSSTTKAQSTTSWITAGLFGEQDSSQPETTNEQIDIQIAPAHEQENLSSTSTAASSPLSAVFDAEILPNSQSKRSSLFDIFWDIDKHIEGRFLTLRSNSPPIRSERIPLESTQKEIPIIDAFWETTYNFGNISYDDFYYSLTDENAPETRFKSSGYSTELVEASETLKEQALEELLAPSTDTPTYTEISHPVSIASSNFRKFSPESPVNRPTLRRQPKYSNLRDRYLKDSLIDEPLLNNSSQKKTDDVVNSSHDQSLALDPARELIHILASSLVPGSYSESAPTTPKPQTDAKTSKSLASNKVSKIPILVTPISKKQAHQTVGKLKSNIERSPSSSPTTPNYARHTLSSQAKVVNSPKFSPAQHPRVDELTKKFKKQSKTLREEVDTRPLGPRPILPLPQPIDTTPKIPSRLRPLRVASPIPENFAYVVNWQPLYGPQQQKADLQYKRITAEMVSVEENAIHLKYSIVNGYGSELVARLEETMRDIDARTGYTEMEGWT